jgi:hypothetical protein
MATIALIVIRVISLLVKRNKLMREVFCWLAVGRALFFFHQKTQNERWEVVGGIFPLPEIVDSRYMGGYGKRHA